MYILYNTCFSILNMWYYCLAKDISPMRKKLNDSYLCFFLSAYSVVPHIQYTNRYLCTDVIGKFVKSKQYCLLI